MVPSFNVADGKGTVSSTLTNSHKFTSIGAVDGVIATDYIFASPEEAQVGEVVLQLNDEPEITLSNVPSGRTTRPPSKATSATTTNLSSR